MISTKAKLEQQKQVAIIPKGFKSLKRIFTKKSCQMENTFASIRMRVEMNALHAKLFMLELDTKLIPEKNKHKYTLEGLKQTRMKNLNRKFTKLVKQRKKKVITRYKMDVVLNLSSIDLSADEMRVLAWGFIFGPTL